MLQKELVSWLLITLLHLSPATGISPGHVTNTEKGPALDGYDPVAYFCEGRPVRGNSGIGYRWNGTRWMFSSERNRELFMSNPELYAPRYGGYCAYGLSRGLVRKGNPEAWLLMNGKLYLSRDKETRNLLKRTWAFTSKKADEQWSFIVERCKRQADCAPRSSRPLNAKRRRPLSEA